MNIIYSYNDCEQETLKNLQQNNLNEINSYLNNCENENAIVSLKQSIEYKTGIKVELKEILWIKKQKLGQFYTTNSKYITTNLLDIFPQDSIVVDPFSGNWDLLNLLDKNIYTIEAFDIDPKNNDTIKRDMLKYYCNASRDNSSHKRMWLLQERDGVSSL